jgi:hypothetical protein
MKDNIRHSIRGTLLQSIVAAPLIVGGIEGFCTSTGMNHNEIYTTISQCTLGAYSAGGAAAGASDALGEGKGMLFRASAGGVIGFLFSAITGAIGYGIGYSLGNFVKGGNK